MAPLQNEFERHPSRVFRHAAPAVAVVWFVLGSLALAVTAATHGQHWRLFLVLVVASGVVSIVALLPGMLLPAVRPSAAIGTSASLFMVGCVAAMAIRAVGTVALVVVCRYKIAADPAFGFGGGMNYHDSILPIASLVIGVLYVGVTIVEVQRLARGGKMLDRRRPAGFAGHPSR